MCLTGTSGNVLYSNYSFTCKNYTFDIILQYSDIKRVSFSIFEIRLLG